MCMHGVKNNMISNYKAILKISITITKQIPKTISASMHAN